MYVRIYTASHKVRFHFVTRSAFHLYIPCITRHVDTENHLHIYHMIFKVSNWKGVPSHRALYTMRSYARGVRFDHILVRNMRTFIPDNRSSDATCVSKTLTRERSVDRLARRLFRNSYDRNGPLTMCALKKKRPESSNPASLIVH
ncbi:hypothetical protein ALC60_08444 [Trachymyrmex zeteki]|uniref:Uncharacterized protein n=1 Tax=Mycetomoellerius zeteki TaxID=64791 RepID=A0A151WX24_9HYME|nr:hypothetical protein ALC60_08444 [Trachymyrmex zeteki]